MRPRAIAVGVALAGSSERRSRRCPAASAASTPFAATTSSVWPSAAIADERIVWLIVSPVASAAAMIAVPSIRPTTISALRPAAPARRCGRRAGRRRGCAARARRPRRARSPSTATSTTASAADRDAEELAHRPPPQHAARSGRIGDRRRRSVSRPGGARNSVTNFSNLRRVEPARQRCASARFVVAQNVITSAFPSGVVST